MRTQLAGYRRYRVLPILEPHRQHPGAFAVALRAREFVDETGDGGIERPVAVLMPQFDHIADAEAQLPRRSDDFSRVDAGTFAP